MKNRILLAAAIAAALPGTAALAHHGWGWTETEESRLAGEIVSISFGNPHMHLKLRSMGEIWNVDLAPPIVAEGSGFGPQQAAAGDRAIITGHRARDKSMRGFKGETITVRGRTFDVYPRREKSLEPQA